ncbi:unnamed protein product [Linum trigynum]|uniref:Uncharacterized protein n=1 Tax=Linum trigynum TaxID=586398 RepID=A0AAV2GV87_9ROSI
MIPIGSIVKLELLEEEGSGVWKKKKGIWLSVGSGLRYLLWELISPKQFNENVSLRAQCELQVFIIRLICHGARGDARKDVYQVSQNAMKEPGNCPDLAKAGTEFKMLPLKTYNLSLRDAFELIQVGGDRGSSLLQRQGIG